MKFNWGHGITVFMIGFVAFMGYLVYLTFNVQFDLVAEDYYAQEMQYENRLVQMRNVADLESTPEITIGETSIHIQLPKGQHDCSGAVEFYDPIAKSGDKHFQWTKEQQGSFSFPLSNFQSHRYEVRLMWENNGKEFFHKEEIYIQK